MELAFSVKKKTKWRTSHPEGARFPATPPPLGTDIYGEGKGRSLQFVWRTDLELDLERTQNYCAELFALYLRRMII